MHTHQGHLYFVTWIDNKSCKVFVAGMCKKSEVVKHFKAFVSWVELETGQSLKILRSDRGGKYIAGELQKFLTEKGIKHKMTTTDTLQHNGVTERMNCMLVK
jgi:transposase InsO family protein